MFNLNQSKYPFKHAGRFIAVAIAGGLAVTGCSAEHATTPIQLPDGNTTTTLTPLPERTLPVQIAPVETTTTILPFGP